MHQHPELLYLPVALEMRPGLGRAGAFHRNKMQAFDYVARVVTARDLTGAGHASRVEGEKSFLLLGLFHAMPGVTQEDGSRGRKREGVRCDH